MLYSKLRLFCAAVLILVAATSARADIIDLAWTPSTDGAVTGYIVYVGNQPGAYTESYDVGQVSTFTYSRAVAGQAYYFAVAAYDQNSTVGPKSTEVSWTVSAVGVTAATLVSPVGTSTSATPTFVWNSGQGAASYVLYVDDSVTKAKVRLDLSPAQAGCQTTAVCKFAPGVSLAAGEAYWAVKTVTSAGSGPWSDLLGFLVAAGSVTAPTLVSPVGTSTSSTPTFVWNAGQGAVSYVLYVDDSVTKAKVRMDLSPSQAGCQTTTVCKFTPGVPLAGGEAYWAVKSVTSAGTGPWSDLLGFMVAANTAPVVSIASPTGGTFAAGTSISFAGSATDTQDGNLASRLAWTSSIDGQLGTGSSFTKVLSAGAHVITASVTDSGGLAASRQVSLSVSAPNTAPVVSIVTPANTTFPAGTSIAFSGSARDTEDGDLGLRLAWTSSIDGSLGIGASLTKALSSGAHIITASVTDSGGLTASRQVLVSVSAPNTAPVVSIASPTGGTFAAGTSIAFAGSATDTQDGNLGLRLAWTSSLDGSLGTGASFTKSLSPGTHVVTASVTDSGGLSASRQVSLTVSAPNTAPNTAPTVAIASPTSTTFPTGTSIAFSGSATDTQDGNLASRLAWTSSIDGPIGTGASFTKALSPGTHVVTASVTDSGGLSASRQVSLTVAAPVAPPNTAPTVSIASPTATVFPAGSSIAFAGTATDGQDGNLASRMVWTSSVDGPLGTGASFIRPLSAGTHIVTAAATDSGGLTGSRQMSITVGGANTAPVVTIASPASKTFPAGTAIAFSGSATDSQDGNLTPRMVWISSLTGQIGSGGSFTTALAQGTHVITARVTDGGGATSSREVTVAVAAPDVDSRTQVMLTASAYKIRASQRVDLTWSGLSTTRIDVYRDGLKIATVSNTGYWTDLMNKTRGRTYTYSVCGTGTTTCSNQVSATF